MKFIVIGLFCLAFGAIFRVVFWQDSRKGRRFRELRDHDDNFRQELIDTTYSPTDGNPHGH